MKTVLEYLFPFAVTIIAVIVYFGWQSSSYNKLAYNQSAPIISEITPSTPSVTITQEVKANIPITKTPTQPVNNGGNLPCSSTYASPSEILNALNAYRNTHGASNLNWDDRLVSVAQMRVNQTLEGGRDNHQGFIDFTNDPENFKKAGYSVLSENIGYACPLAGVHLIEQKIANSPSHDSAQRDPSWISVGIATSNGITSFIFGKNPY